MKKLSKKVLSVFVALVLVLGIFSVILPTAKLTTNVNAETAQQTFNYSVLLGDKSKGHYVPDTRVLHNSDGIDFLGIFNSQGLAVRSNGALGVADAFFTGTPVGAAADEIHPYIVYNVVPGTSFTLSSAGYNETLHKNTGCADDERFFNFYVSNDGVNWIPVDAKKEFTGVWGSSASYDTYNYFIDNVGLKTNFVKVEYPMTMASRRTPDYVYFPNESLMVTSVTLTKPETYSANGETLFQAKLYTTQKELYDSYFSVFPEIICADDVTDPENLDNHYKAATVTEMNDVAWGTYKEEKARSFVAMVEPGSRFYLETANQHYMRTLGQFMVNNSEISSIDQARIRVYTSATLSDNASDWIEWQPMEYTMYALSSKAASTPIFNFYLPEDHVYVKIVYPHKGDFRVAMLNGAAVAGEAGNTGCFFNDMVFTPYKIGGAEETYDYTVSGTKGYTNEALVVETTNGIRAKNDNLSKNLPNGHPNNTNKNSPFKKGYFSATYTAEGGKMFSLEYAIRMKKETNGYGEGAYKANSGGKKMGFEISVSSDGVNWSSAYKVLPTYAQSHEVIGTSGIRAYKINYNVPASAKFVRVDYDIIGNGYIYTNADETASEYRYFNDAMYIRKVSIANANTAAKDLGYVYTVDTEANLGTISNNDKNPDSDLGKGTQKGVAALSPSWTYLKQNTAAIAGTLPRAYVTYDIMPGTTFESDFSMRYQAIEMSEKTAQKNVNEGLLTGAKQELVEYEFFIYGKNKNSDTWQLFGKTDSDKLALSSATVNYNTFGYGSFSVDFPDYVNQVKIEFPQTGGFYKDTTNWKDIACGNDGAYLYNMKFVAPDSDIVGSHYSKKETANIASTDKKDLSIYHFGGVSIVNCEGIKAKTDNAFVIYKIKENTMLSLKSEYDLSFEYSVDDVSYKPFEAVRVRGYYEIPAISGRNYIKIKLKNGEAITYANAEMAPPTAKFYIPYLNKYELVDYSDYGATATSVSWTISTLRPGYTFTSWGGYSDTNQVYIDTVFEAAFEKSDKIDYTVDWTVNGVTETKTGVKFDDKITITAPRENDGKVFVKWVDGKKNTVSDNPTFSFLASGSISLTAVYADSKEALSPYIYMTETPIITTNDNGTWNLSVVWRSAMPKDVHIVETGILLGADVEKSGLVLWDGKTQSGTAKMQHNNTSANKTAMYTVKNIKPDTVRTALPFARLSNGSVIYADNVLKVKDGVKIDSDFEFYGKISPEVLSRYLDRSLTYTAFDTTGSETRTSAIYSTKDVIRQTGAKYFARALCHWTPSSSDENSFNFYKDAIKQVHDMDPEIIMEACIFETCGVGMNGISIPAWVFEAFGKTPETRNFDYNLMRHEDHAATSGLFGTNFLEGYGWNQWGTDKHIPSISTEEFQMFVYYRACRYIDMGIEAIHFGQMNLVGAITEYEKDSGIFTKTGHWNITGYDTENWTKVIGMINDYAKDHARRGYLIVNGHYPDQNLTSTKTGRMLVDFNMFPLRITAKTGSTSHTPSEGFQEVMLATSSDSDAPYSSSRQANAANKTSPSGYDYANYPYLLEFDNWGVKNVDALNTPSGAWGYDEISWYANQNATDRHQYLIDISLEVKNLTSAPNGHVALPGRRTTFIHKDGRSEFLEQEWTQSFINDDTNQYKGIGVQHPLWDIRTAGDVQALKAAWQAIGSYGNHYDYTDDGDTLINITNSNKYEYGISEFGGPALVNNESGSGSAIFRGIHPGYGVLGTDWSDTATAPYVIYKVKPGTVMSIDLYMYQSGKTAFENAGYDFDFKIECSSSISDGWENDVTTDSYSETNINILYSVPSDCKYVKITFPQKGKLSGTSGARGNDYARIMGVKFVSQ